jgi:hypothetical protein
MSGPSATRAAPVSVPMSIKSSGAPSSASASASARTSRPSASVLPTSTVSPLRDRYTSRGRKAAPEIAFSTAGMSTLSRTLSLRSMIMCASASTLAAPPMSFFISNIALSGLMSRPPESKQTPFPTSVTRGRSASPHCSSMSRGAATDARPTAWISGKFSASKFSPTMALIFAP